MFLKVYVIEYDFEIIKINSLKSEIEHKIQSFTDATEFMNAVKEKQGKYYISNIKVYSGEVSEIVLNKVLNPF